MEHTLAVTLGDKLPPNSGMAKDFKVRTKDALVNGFDTVRKAMTRIKILISEKREHSRLAKIIGPDTYLSVVDEKNRTVGKQYAEAVPVPQQPYTGLRILLSSRPRTSRVPLSLQHRCQQRSRQLVGRHVFG